MPEEMLSQPQPITTPTPPKTNILPIVLAVLLTFTTTATAFFAYLYFQKPIVTPPTPVASPKPPANDAPPDNRAPNGAPASLTSSWKGYTIQQLNLTFKVPESIDFTVAPKTTTSHKNIFWNDVLGSNLRIVATSPQSTFEGSFAYLNGCVGYKKTSEGYQYLIYTDASVDIPTGLAKEYTTVDDMKYLLVNEDKQAVNTMPGPGMAEPGTIGAIIHTGNKDYPAITVQMKLSSENTQEVFQQILGTFKLTP